KSMYWTSTTHAARRMSATHNCGSTSTLSIGRHWKNGIGTVMISSVMSGGTSDGIRIVASAPGSPLLISCTVAFRLSIIPGLHIHQHVVKQFLPGDSDVKSHVGQHPLDDERESLYPREVFEQSHLNAGHVSEDDDTRGRFVSRRDDLGGQRVCIQIVTVINCGESACVFVRRES